MTNRPPPLRSTGRRFEQNIEPRKPNRSARPWIIGVGALVIGLILLYLLLLANHIATPAPSGNTKSEAVGEGVGAEPAEEKPEGNEGEAPSESESKVESTRLPSQDEELDLQLDQETGVDSGSNLNGDSDSVKNENDPEPELFANESAGDDSEFLAKSSRSSMTLTPIHRKVKFFGIESKGNHVVFVVDKSGSMAGERIERAKKELLRSLNELSENQFFSIYFFDHQAFYDNRFIDSRASQNNLTALKEWLDRIYGDGSTDPLPACKLAFNGRGDVMFLLTDGEFYGGEMITLWNTKRIPISTIGLGDDTETLKVIAQQNQGIYKFVQ